MCEMVRAPLRAPVATGAKRAVAAQVAPGDSVTLAVQVVETSEKSLPVTMVLLICSVALPVLVSVTLCPIADDPTIVSANASELAELDATGADGVPVGAPYRERQPATSSG